MVKEEKDFFETESGFKSCNFTCVGAGHIKNGTLCQDASYSVNTKQYSLAVVCDGHGGEDYFRSDRGSKMAVDAFCSCVADKAFVKRFDKLESESELPDLISQLIKSVILRWNTAVEKDLKEFPITQEELKSVSDKARRRYDSGEKLPTIYGTTLIGFVCGKRWCFGVQIGDGKCVVANKWGQLIQPIPWDDKCFLNVTTSLSDENAYEEFRYWYSQNLNKDFPVAVFLGSDGIDDSFAGDEKLHDFYRLILKNLAESKTVKPLTELMEYLPSLSEQGSKDDISFGIIFKPNELRWDAERWNGIGRRILVDNSGDMDNDDDGPRFYHHMTVIPAEEGSYPVSIGRSGCYTLEILSVGEKEVRLCFRGEEHLLTADKQLEFSESERQATYDGPWHNASDDTKITLL